MPDGAADVDAAGIRDEIPSGTPVPGPGDVTLSRRPPRRRRPGSEAPQPAPVGPNVAMQPVDVISPPPSPVTGSVPALVPVASQPVDLVPLSELAPAIAEVSVSRRTFLGFGLSVVGGLTGATVLSRFFPVFAETSSAPPPIVPAYDPVGKAWTFVVDTTACIGCGLCVVACKEENEVTRDPEFNRTWVERHAVASDGTVYIDAPDAGINGFPAVSTAAGVAGQTIESAFFEPRLCMQCENSPCTVVCPVGATYRTADGIILVDARRCIGCGYCVVACPYGARYIAPAGDRAPNGTPGVADKCTWCYHRISRGDLPACVEICPVGARKFGDVTDPDSEIAKIVRERAPKALHPEFGTRPRVLYLGPAAEEA